MNYKNNKKYTTKNIKTKKIKIIIATIKIIVIIITTTRCGIKNTHAGSSFIKTNFQNSKKEKFKENFLVKDRNEPCTLIQVVVVVIVVIVVVIFVFLLLFMLLLLLLLCCCCFCCYYYYYYCCYCYCCWF